MNAVNGCAGLSPGAKNTKKADIDADCVGIVSEKQHIKPEVDLQSWAALGQSVKPSRTDRRTKASWKRGAK